jgi:hypothetical protein
MPIISPSFIALVLPIATQAHPDQNNDQDHKCTVE